MVRFPRVSQPLDRQLWSLPSIDPRMLTRGARSSLQYSILRLCIGPFHSRDPRFLVDVSPVDITIGKYVLSFGD